MQIRFVSPVYTVDEHVHRAFVEVLNLVLLSDHIAELDRRLKLNDVGGRLSGDFKWSFADHNFTLWQRMSFGGREYFKPEILSLHHVTLVCGDRERACAVKN